ncbi:MAG TPA: transcriptional regulator [Sphingomonas sp.]|uniref:helix-turn-helix domain-containing transcriptional regulator n=1 Tax=Sphingomonas sp. TaxID=28214 RepID=UPI002C940425|nr:transcriptional regulator [Sphingomonas sp.]HMI19700.1 transcriptional regulator [Sphingomonas sp.]
MHASIGSDPPAKGPALEARLNRALSSHDTDEAVAAIREAVLAHGVTHLSRDTGLDRVNLYKMLSAGGNPKVGTLLKILDVLGLRIEVAPVRRRRSRA